MTLTQLELVLAISETGSLHGASAILGKTQPTLTKALKQLEDELGVAIFIRSSRGMTPTDLGLQIIARARIICSEQSKLKEDIAQLLGSMQGEASVCVSPFVAYAMTPGVLTDYRKKWPEIEVNINEGVYPNSLKRLREGQVDFAIGPLPEQPVPDLDSEILFDTKLIAVRSKAFPHSVPSREELSDANWMVMSSRRGPGRLYHDMFLANGMTPPTKVTWMESFTALLKYLRTASCCCLIPEKLLVALPEDIGLERLDVFDNPITLSICMFTKPNSPMTPAADELARLFRLHASSFR